MAEPELFVYPFYVSFLCCWTFSWAFLCVYWWARSSDDRRLPWMACFSYLPYPVMEMIIIKGSARPWSMQTDTEQGGGRVFCHWIEAKCEWIISYSYDELAPTFRLSIWHQNILIWIDWWKFDAGNADSVAGICFLFFFFRGRFYDSFFCFYLLVQSSPIIFSALSRFFFSPPSPASAVYMRRHKSERRKATHHYDSSAMNT